MIFWGKRAKITSIALMCVGTLGLILFGVLFAIGGNHKADVNLGGSDTYTTIRESPKNLQYGVGLFNYGTIYSNGAEINIKNNISMQPLAEQLKNGSYRDFVKYWNERYEKGWYKDNSFYSQSYEISREFCSIPQKAFDMLVVGAVLSVLSFFLIVTGLPIYVINKKKIKAAEENN